MNYDLRRWISMSIGSDPKRFPLNYIIFAVYTRRWKNGMHYIADRTLLLIPGKEEKMNSLPAPAPPQPRNYQDTYPSNQILLRLKAHSRPYRAKRGIVDFFADIIFQYDNTKSQPKRPRGLLQSAEKYWLCGLRMVFSVDVTHSNISIDKK